MEQRFWLLLSLKFSNEASLAELEELDIMLQQHPELFLQYEALKKLWEKQDAAVNTERQYDKHLQRLSNHLSLPALQYENEQEFFNIDKKKVFLKKRDHKKFLFPAVAAAVLIAITLVFFLNTEKKICTSCFRKHYNNKARFKIKSAVA